MSNKTNCLSQVNNNNNNNNNNDNNNNNNVGNVNVANANNNANNENMATAGRRRTLKRLERLREFVKNPAKAVDNQGLRIPKKNTTFVSFKPIKIKYLTKRSSSEDDANVDVIAEETSLVALIYVNLFTKLEKMDQQNGSCVQRMFCCAAKAAGKLMSPLAEKMAKTLQEGAIKLSNLPHFDIQSASSCSSTFAKCKSKLHACD